MSIKVVSWALNEAPVETPVHVLILVAMAERCHDDGTESRQSAATIASKARVSTRTVQRELRKLESMGVIRRGDQSLNSFLPVNRRPVVYDLAVELKRGDNLSYQDFDTTTTTSVDTTSTTDTTSEPLRYDTDDTLIRQGCRTTSPLTSPLTSPSREVPHQCSHGYDPADCALCLNPPPSRHWQPSPAALAQAKASVRITDIGLSIASYEVWCKRHGREMSNGEWLTWILRDEKQARAERAKETAAKLQPRGWASVEE
jgi:hypothetical protein